MAYEGFIRVSGNSEVPEVTEHKVRDYSEVSRARGQSLGYYSTATHHGNFQEILEDGERRLRCLEQLRLRIS